MSRLKLLWKSRELGSVSDVSGEYPWMHGAFKPATLLDEGFQALFIFLMDEERSNEEPPFNEELLDEGNWWLLDTRGNRWGISLPAVHLDEGTISWRWRGPEIPNNKLLQSGP